jgi:hypothetical protein
MFYILGLDTSTVATFPSPTGIQIECHSRKLNPTVSRVYYHTAMLDGKFVLYCTL